MSDVSRIIEQLGGTNALAAELGVLPSAVRNWRSAGAFPLKHHIAITRLAEKHSVVVGDSLFRALNIRNAAA